MSDLDALKAEIRKLSAQAVQAKMDLHDLSEELPTGWETLPAVAGKCFEIHARLAEARRQLQSAGG